MSNTVVIFSEIPEDTRIFVIPDEVITPEHELLLAGSHGKLVNFDGYDDSLRFVNNAFCKVLEHCGGDEIPEDWKCIYTQYEVKIEVGKPILGRVSRVIHTGFIL